ncbi:MAG: GC-type dockerin domain-anchored protein [Planctomycetota bacterium]
MTRLRTCSLLSLVALAGTASAQSASLSLTANTTTAAPGDTITVSLVVDYDIGAAGSGVFGSAGLFGFGGEVSADSGDVSASTASVSGALTSGVTADTSGSALVRAAAGRTLIDGGLVQDPATVLTFDVTVDPSAADGTVTLSYDGAVVLSLDDALVTFATAPGTNQSTLTTSTLEITIGANSCIADITTDGANPGDPDYLVPDGAVSVSDLSTFVEQWLAGDLAIADITTDGANPGDPDYLVPDGAVSVSDLSTFVEQWLAGCP